MINRRRFILWSETQFKSLLVFLTEEVTLPDGKEQKRPYKVTIEPYVARKTEEQRAGFHWLCKTLGDELGYTVNEIKEMCKRECMGTRTISIGAHTQEITGSSEDLNKLEYSELIETVYRLGAEAGVFLPELDKDRKSNQENNHAIKS